MRRRAADVQRNSAGAADIADGRLRWWRGRSVESTQNNGAWRSEASPSRQAKDASALIADLSANHFERQALLCGHSVERIAHDYGVDLILYTYDRYGEIENGMLSIQLKATDRIRHGKRQKAMRHSVSRTDLNLWLKEPMPVILVLYDAEGDLAYWQYVQAYFEDRSSHAGRAATSKSATIHLPRANVLDMDAIQKFVQFKNDVLSQLDRKIRHHV